jgi:kynurenine 3-monooxygenase
MHRGQAADFHQEYLSEGYKELTIPADAAGRYQLDAKSLHVWPRGAMVLIAIPNSDGSFTCTLTLPFHGECSFDTLQNVPAVRSYFQRFYPDVLSLAPGIVAEFLSHSPGRYLTTKTWPWHQKGRVVLIGDACHSVLPFYGQGMNAAFEDCAVLADCLASEPGDTESAFAKYQQLRKRNTDALADLSTRNYFELREKVRSPLFVARKSLEIKLNRIFPNLYVPLYSLVTHTTTPYADAVERCMRQDRLLRLMGLNAVLPLIAAWALLAQWRSRLSQWMESRSRRLVGALGRALGAAGIPKTS